MNIAKKILLIEPSQNVLKLLRNHRKNLVNNPLRNLLVKSLCNAARDAGERVGVAAKRNSKPYRALEISTFQKRYNSLWHSALARAIEIVG